MTERQLMDGITAAAKQLGYLVFHPLISHGSEPGWPDLVIAGHGVVRFIECKGPRGRISGAQQAWMDALTEAGCVAWFVWPEDYHSVLDHLVAAREKAIAA